MRYGYQNCQHRVVDKWSVRLVILQQPLALSVFRSGFSYYSPISVNAAQVPSTQTDFPVLVSVTDARLKDVAHSGHVNNSSGFDIRPYTSTTLRTAITGYELEKYVPTTGELIMWVKVSSLSSSTTPIYLAYGNTTLSTDGSSATCWSNSFLRVFHLSDGTTLSLVDSTGNANGTNHSVTATTGQIDGAGGFVSASSQYVDLGSGIAPTSITLSAWIKPTSFPNAYNTVISRDAVGFNYASMFVKSTGKMAMYVTLSSGTAAYDPGSHTLSAGTWYHVALTFDGPTANVGLKGYVNAASDGNVNSSLNLATTSSGTAIGEAAQGGSFYFNGTIDEARVASVSRSADWITTEYNNQNAPGTFETLGTEVAL